MEGEVQEGGIPGPEPGEGAVGEGGPAVGEGTSSGGSLPPLYAGNCNIGGGNCKGLGRQL